MLSSMWILEATFCHFRPTGADYGLPSAHRVQIFPLDVVTRAYGASAITHISVLETISGIDHGGSP